MSDPVSRAHTVLVTDADRGSALAIIRSLGRRGWRVIAADAHSGSLGFRSRYAASARIYPAPQSDPVGMVAALRRAVDEERVDLLIPVTDDVILPLSAARDQFAGRCRVAMPEPDQLEIVTNKHRTVELAQRLGVPAPATVVVRTVDEARAALGSLGWPVVVKPQVSRLYGEAGVDRFEVSYAPDAATLLRLMSHLEGRCAVLLQEYYPGTGYGVELLMRAGRPLAAFQHKRLHEVPITGGASSFRESVALDPALYDYSVRLLEALKWTGLAMVEFKVGADGPRLMEINGRIWGSLPLATLSGMDFPARLAALYEGGASIPEGPPETRYKVGVKARNLEKDVLWIGSVLLGRRRHTFLPVPPRRAAVGGLLSLFDPRHRSDLWAADDLGPFVAEFPKVAAKLLRKGAMAGKRQGGAP